MAQADDLLKTALSHHQAGRISDAERLYRGILSMEAHHAESLHLLGVIAYQRGRYEEAVSLIERAILAGGPIAVYFSNMGLALEGLGRPEQARTVFERALISNPGYPDALSNIGGVLRTLGDLNAAVRACERAVRLRPDYAEAHANRGTALTELGSMQAALLSYDLVLCIAPHMADAYFNRGTILKDTGRLEEAAVVYERAALIKPDHINAYYNRGNVLQRLGRLDQAVRAYRSDLNLKPASVETYASLGNALYLLGRRQESCECFTRAIHIRPDHVQAFSNRGVTLTEMGRHAEALADYEEAIRLDPAFAESHSGRLIALHYREHTADKVILEAARQFGAQFDRDPPATFRNDPSPDRRLRLGYVSGDFCRHPVGYFLLQVLENHSGAEMELFCYSANPSEDDMTVLLRAHADLWRSVAGLSDEAVADLVRADEIDILIDLSGHTSMNRLGVFALKPAPIQVSWLGYFGTTGLVAMDYVLADRHVLPKEEESCFTERIWRLPDSYLCFSAPQLDIPLLPVEPDGALTFGSFNNHAKTSPETINLWAEILNRVPGSRLLLKTKAFNDEAARLRLREDFARRGISSERLLLEGSAPRAELLAAYGRLDIALDPTPYGGGTTTVEALWMGVPVVTLRGGTWVGRVSESILATIGLTEFVAGDSRDYADIAVQLAKDVPRRHDLRVRLRSLIEASPLFDGRRFTHNLEAAYRGMWKSWCAVRSEVKLRAALGRHEAGFISEAQRLYRLILIESGNNADALHLLGVLAHQQGRSGEAILLIYRALAIAGQAPAYLSNLGLALSVSFRFEEAERAFKAALCVRPAYTEAHNNRSDALGKLGEASKALRACDRAILLRRGYVDAYSNRGIALRDLARLDEAAAACRHALCIDPSFAPAYLNRGVALAQLGRTSEAIVAYEHSLHIDPLYVDAHSNRANSLEDLGQHADACLAYAEAIRLNPGYSEAHSNRLLALHYREKAAGGAILSAARQFGAQFDGKGLPAPFVNFRDPGRRLRVGYVSGDFRSHPVGYFLLQVLVHHADAEVDLFCYSANSRDDDLTAQLRAQVGHWRSLGGLSDAAAAALIRTDGIDILVDLSGHTSLNRLPMFALKPAPVQVSWLGYFGTTGLAAMDYVLADGYVLPEGEEAYFIERVYRLPQSYLCFSAPQLDIPPLPVELNRPLTFGSFNNHAKTSPETIALWAEILGRVPGSRLLLKTKALEDSAARQSVREGFARAGVEPERLVLEGSVPRAELLAAYGRVDIALDPTPYGGGTTTVEALWMGVPVVTLRGGTWVGRVSESVLATIGLAELVGDDAGGYTDIAVQLAVDAPRRNILRSRLRSLIEASPLFDGRRFTRNLETAYRDMWKSWCGGKV